jgi:DUF2914 family protein/helix-turn-helix protein
MSGQATVFAGGKQLRPGTNPARPLERFVGRLVSNGFRTILGSMESFGQKVRQAIESGGLRLDDVAEATGLKIEQIQALARDDFGALPDDDIVIRALRSFARLVEVDEDQVIQDYRRERQRWRAEVSAKVEIARDPPLVMTPSVPRLPQDVHSEITREPPVVVTPGMAWPPEEVHREIARGPSVVMTPAVSRSPQEVQPRRQQPDRNRLAMTATAVALVLAVVTLVLWLHSSPAPASGRGVAEHRDTMAGANETPEPSKAPPGSEGSRSIQRPASPPVPAAGASIGAPYLSIQEHGVGKGIIRHDLVGKTKYFKEGERAWFWTRVEGGARGAPIEHVWIHDGDVSRRVSMKLGAATWRTASYKDLGPGSAGNWVVEARDKTGRLLARNEFRCSPRP